MLVNTLVMWALILGAVWLALRGWRHHVSNGDSGRPERVLAERYAKGEIDETEYRQRLEVLRGHSR